MRPKVFEQLITNDGPGMKTKAPRFIVGGRDSLAWASLHPLFTVGLDGQVADFDARVPLRFDLPLDGFENLLRKCLLPRGVGGGLSRTAAVGVDVANPQLVLSPVDRPHRATSFLKQES